VVETALVLCDGGPETTGGSCDSDQRTIAEVRERRASAFLIAYETVAHPRSARGPRLQFRCQTAEHAWSGPQMYVPPGAGVGELSVLRGGQGVARREPGARPDARPCFEAIAFILRPRGIVRARLPPHDASEEEAPRARRPRVRVVKLTRPPEVLIGDVRDAGTTVDSGAVQGHRPIRSNHQGA
jgi:hypothetical protein